MGKHGASPLRRVCTPRSHIDPPTLGSSPMLLRLQHQHQHRYMQLLHTSSLVFRMGYNTHDSPANGHSGGSARPCAPRAPHSVWRPENGIVFSAPPTPGPGPSSSSTYQTTGGAYSAQQPLVFGQSSSFGQAPSYDQAPSYGQAPTFGQAPSFGQAQSFDSTSSFGQARSFEGTPSFEQAHSFDSTSLLGQARSFDSTSSLGQARSFERTPSFERAPSFGKTASSSQDAPVFGQTPSFAPRLPSLTQQPAFGQSPFGRPTFVQPSFTQPSRPMFVYSNQNKSRLIHTSSERAFSSHPAQAPPEKTTPKHTGAVESGVDQAETKEEEAAETAEAVEKPAQIVKDTKVLPPETDLDFKVSRTLFDKARDAAPGSPESYWSYTLYRNKTASKKSKGTDSSNQADGSTAGNSALNTKDTEAVLDTESVTSDSHSVHSSVTNSAEEAGDGIKGDHERVKVHYCKSREATERVCAQYFADEPMLGFDLEWMADAAKWEGPRKNVCLLQLASPSRIGLFHLFLFPTRDLMPPTLRKILETPDIIKAGVNIKGDATRLRNHLAVNMQGLVELSHLHRLVKYSKTGEHHLISKRLVSLAAQVEENLKLPLFKGQDVRAGNWSRPLRMDQIIYSASDAYASVQIFAVLEKERLSLDPTPPRPAFAELNTPIKLASGAVVATASDSAADDAEQALQGGNETADAAAPLTSEITADAEHTVSVEGEAIEDGSQVKDSPISTKRKSISTVNTDKTAKNPKAPATPKVFTDARLVASHQWMGQYRESKAAPVKATAACLRAYHLWHSNTDLDAEMIAAMLRDPPLKTTTVVGYVLSAVQLEKLPYDKSRCRAELMEQLPHKIRLSKYRGLARICGYDLTAPDPALAQN
ncbi:3 -5 exonuclease [Ophiostoma piceae UAMH 11346]|uniref:3-5 exonuclease n=1 Tax=Ophiostoma piceae (strain UAMH 11346) TaxID=1262450 RepID=S3CUB2_OPHP1|nr:3 -5 exonuclease [Ophiostoma piceae UAMH 11346]